jgi:hypothetical protein
MTTNIAVAVQGARPTIPFVLKSVLPAETESRLDRIRCGAPVAEVYRDESRPWLDQVDDDKVYETIATDQFQAYVRLISAIA